MKINILGGTGVMGRIHKPIFESSGHEVIMSSARKSKEGVLDFIEAAKNSDITIVSVPIPFTEEVIKKVAPYCPAIMDFTSLKVFPVEAMLKYSNPDAEVGGLHPLYGEISSIKNQTVIYCPTNRSGKKCMEIIKCLESAGANIIISSPLEHDHKIAITQNARLKLIEAYASLIKSTGYNIEEIYKFSPPPTKILLDLLARQFNESNDEMYKAMKDYNPFNNDMRNKLIDALTNHENSPDKIRKLFGKELENSKKRIADIIENYDK
jgi:prephenate dehydrogenase